MPELVLADVDRDALASGLNGVRVAQLVRREASLTPASSASWRSPARAAVADQRRPRV